jgi:polyvinyl alcohol dehydrogenase (cytochrome)
MDIPPARSMARPASPAAARTTAVVTRPLAGLAALFALTATAFAQAPDGKVLFTTTCASCHDGTLNSRAQSPEVLRQRSPDAIMTAMGAGSMRPQASRLTGAERRAVAEYVTGKGIGGDVTGSAMGWCASTAPFSAPSVAPFWNGWGVDAGNTRYQPATQAGLTAEEVPKLVLKWAFGFPDATSAWSQPAVFGARLFVGSHNGTVYSLDAKSGCIYWTFSAAGSVRTAMAIGRRSGNGYTVYFGDSGATAYALDAASGRQLWSRRVDDHPLSRITGSPALYGDRLLVPIASYEEAAGGAPDYACCTFRGSLSALDAATGTVVWKTYVAPEPKPRGKSSTGVPLWGPAGAAIWSAPTVDAVRGLVYAATGNAYSEPTITTSDAVIAFDLKTGAIRWTNQVTPHDVFVGGCRSNSGNPNCSAEVGPDYDFGNSPILAKLPGGRDVIVIGQKSGVGYGMDPDRQGKVIWRYKVGEGSMFGGIEWGSAVDGAYAYFANSDISLAKPGGLHAVKLATGERVWYAAPAPLKCSSGDGCNAAQSAALTVIPGIVFSGSNDGALRAYSTKDGTIVWEFDSNRAFDTLNGVPARGASMMQAGPTVAGGMLYVNSGYGDHGGRSGNVLLAFEVRQ